MLIPKKIDTLSIFLYITNLSKCEKSCDTRVHAGERLSKEDRSITHICTRCSPCKRRCNFRRGKTRWNDTWLKRNRNEWRKDSTHCFANTKSWKLHHWQDARGCGTTKTYSGQTTPKTPIFEESASSTKGATNTSCGTCGERDPDAQHEVCATL